MNDYMNDFRDPIQPTEPVQKSEPTSSYYNQSANNGYSYQSQTSDNVYSAADVYEIGKLSDAGEESMLVELLKSILGAVVGAIPGFILWILIGKVGFVAAICGSALAMGTIAGYTFMTKDNFLPQKYGIITCIAVIAIAVFLADKIVWCWELSEQFKIAIESSRESVYAFGDAGGMTKAEIDEIFNEGIKEQFGFTEGTFSDFFFNFNKTLRNLGVSARYYLDLLMSYLFAGIGGFSLFKKFAG